MARYETEELTLTPRFVEALKELMWAEMEMMRSHEPNMADRWIWGMCRVGDLSSTSSLAFYFGGAESKPVDFPHGTDVWVVDA